ncbi:ectoine hydroxylase [Rhodococcus tibetensis]|uniref:Ectoine hydroxylase n=1 Tax=Rhodococcus tibetensis TaxID=2965064 RepID=A0ABT1Q607_9NOCA|nr:ectoine hydroxylase [Rhodococcus sp. FXJ9.536]MCQ4117679.1 ectoine hydroxylase [Rhodococcus sp. FXJ9.536]
MTQVAQVQEQTNSPDHYPTRISAEPSTLARNEPAVWGCPSDGPFDAAALERHEARGFTIVENLLGADEVVVFREELARLSHDAQMRESGRVITERGTDEVRSVFDVHRCSALVAELVRDGRILDRARQLLGSDVYIHQSRINSMPGFKGTGFYWHSDFETWHAEDGLPIPRTVSCSITLTENFPFNGSLMVMPGSHNSFVQCVGATPENNYASSLVSQEVGVPRREDVTRMAAEYGIEQFTGAAGTALWFDSNVMHGSGNNITPFPRSNIFLVFNSVENTLVEPFAAARPRPEYIASRDFTPLS